MSKVIGITGGIGSGKSTVSRILSEKLNAPILDADKIAKEAVNSPEIISKIKKFFGESIFDNPQIINREKLSDIVFSNENKLLELNKIIHPYVIEEIEKKVNELKQDNEYIILDVPLPNESFINLSDKIIVVVANEETRIKRVMTRSNLSEDSVKKRIEKQMPVENYIKLADFLIKNNSSMVDLVEKINEICEKI
jgi:dephospho-CoA kinase